MRYTMRAILILSQLFCGILYVQGATLAAEQTSEAVELTFYRYSSAEWTSASKSAVLQAEVVTAANDYCSTSPDVCGFDYWNTSAVFTNSDVGIVTSDSNSDKNMKAGVSIIFPSGSNTSISTTTHVVSKAGTDAILTSAKSALEGALQLTITYVDSTYYGIPVAYLENQVIIPIAFVVVFVMMVVVIALHYWNKQRTKKEKKLRRNEKKLHSSKVSPQNSKSKSIDAEMTMEAEKEIPLTTTAPPYFVGNNDFTDNPEPPGYIGYQLPPISSDGAVTEKTKKKKKKKKKKQKEQMLDGDSDSENTVSNSHSNPSYMADTQQTTLNGEI